MATTDSMPKIVKYRDNLALSHADDYLKGTIGIDEVTHKLEQRKAFGRYVIGELALERSSESSPRDSNHWLAFARRNFKFARDSLDPRTTLPIRAKSGSKINQLDIFKDIHVNNKLPRLNLAREAYRNILFETKKYQDISDNSPLSQMNEDLEMRGHLGEMAILLLLQRFSLNEMEEGTWTPLQSYFSEDHGGSCLSRSDIPTWDINIFTKLGRDEPLDKTYNLQVKSNKNAYTLAKDIGADTIYIREDLKLSRNEQRVASLIIHAAYFEMTRPNDSSRISYDLDTRTEKLLDKIDSF